MSTGKSQGLFALTIPQLGQILELGIPLEGIYVLEAVLEGTCPNCHIQSARLEGVYTLLKRKSYLTEDNKITSSGLKLYEDLAGNNTNLKKEAVAQKREIEEAFAKWWKIFPYSDGWTDSTGRKYLKTRVIKSGEERCKDLFQKILLTDGIKPDQIVEATRLHIESLKAKDRRFFI